MKKCPTCGELTNSKFCPECGTNLADVEEIVANDEEVVSITEDDAAESNSYDGSSNEANKQPEPKPAIYSAEPALQDSSSPAAKGKSRTKLIIIAIVVIAVIAGVAFFGIKSAKEKAAQKAYDDTVLFMRTNSSMMQLDVVANPIFALAEPDKVTSCEDLINLTNKVWHDAIFDEYNEDTSKYIKGTSDFNDALTNLYQADDVVELNERMEGHLESAKTSRELLLKNTPIPDSLKDADSAYIKLVTAYQALVNWCSWPNASYSSYMEKSQELYDSFNNAYNEFDLICPQYELPEETGDSETAESTEDVGE